MKRKEADEYEVDHSAFFNTWSYFENLFLAYSSLQQVAVLLHWFNQETEQSWNPPEVNQLCITSRLS